MATRRPRVLGHGPVDGGGSPINTLASFVECRGAHADGVELDVRRTKDDQLVVLHDAEVDGRPVDQTLRSDLPLHVPGLVEVLESCRGLTVNVELKNFPSDPGFDPAQRLTRLVLGLLERRGDVDEVLVSCFDLAAIDLVRAEAPKVPTAALLLSRRPAATLLASVAEHGHRIVHPYDTMVDDDFLRAAHHEGLSVAPWLGEVAPARLDELVALGVDGLVTSQVTAARGAIDRAGRSTTR